MDGQQVYVTGADGEQMVLSGPEAAALLAQAGISLGEQEQVMIGGSGLELGQQAGGELGGEEGSILAPEGSSVAEDGSILAADGTILAPPGTVMIGEDGTLMMAEGSSLLQEPERKEGEVAGIMAGEGNVLLDTEGNVLTDQDGNILTTADIGKLGGAELVGEEEGKVEQQAGEGGQFVNQPAADDGQLLAGTSSGSPVLTTADGNQIITAPDGNVITSDGSFLRTQDGQILTDTEGNFLTADGNVLKPEDAQKLLEESNNVVAGVGEANEISEKAESVNISGDGKEASQADSENNSTAAKEVDAPNLILNSTEQEAADQMKLAVEAAMEEGSNILPASTEEPENKSEAGKIQALDTANLADDQIATAKEEPRASQAEETKPDQAQASEPALGPAEVPAVPTSSQASDILSPEDPVGILPEGQGVDMLQDTSSTAGMVIPASGDGGIYTSADGTVLSVPEGLMTNAEGNLINPADGSILTTEDGTPLVLPQGAVLQSSSSSLPQELASVSSPSSHVSQGGIMVNAAESGIMTTSEAPLVSAQQPSLATTSTGTILAAGSVLASEDGTMMTAPEGSIVASDGSILAADGSVLAPPGSVITTDQQLAPVVQQQQQQQQQPQQQQAAQNLIGLQLPEESGEVLYLDPNDPAAQLLLREAGITLGEGGVLQTADGQVLHSEDGAPITTNSKQTTSSATTRPTNNLMADAAAAAGLSEDLGFQLPTGVKADTSAIDIPLSQQTSNLQPNLPLSQSYSQAVTEEPTQKHIFQPRVGAQQSQQQQSLGASANTSQQKFQKLTFNSNTNYSSPAAAAPAPLQKKAPAPRQRKTVPSTDMQIGPDQQKVTYTVTSENGYSQTYMMICSKTLDQNTLINTLIKNISNDPNHKGKKTIKITQHKYGAKKSGKAAQAAQQRGGAAAMGRQQAGGAQQRPGGQQALQKMPQQQRRVQPNQHQLATLRPAQQQVRPVQGQLGRQVVQQQQQQGGRGGLQQQQAALPQQAAQQHTQPPQQILQSEPDVAEPVTQDHFADSLSLDDIVSQIGGAAAVAGEGGDGEPKVMVKCNYCTNFRCALNSQTWENILNHILPVAKEELHTSFYGNILKHFKRSLRVTVSGKGTDQVEVVVSHGLVCRRTGAWYSVDRPGVELATTLASHIAAVQPGVAGPYGARPRGNSLICLFCCSPYTAEDYQRHLKPHQEFIIPCLLLAAGAYCATSFELEVRKVSVCTVCREPEPQDLRFLPCTKFASDFNCGKRLQSTVDCFRENFDNRGFLQVSNSAMTKCSVCRTPNNTYCALFKPNPATMMIFEGGTEEMLAVCANCQKQFVNVVMRENSFEKQLKMFQLHHMEQLCGMLRVLLSASQAVCSGNFNLLYTVQEGGSLYSASSTLHSVLPAKILYNPVLKTAKVEEDKSMDLSGPSLRYVCDQCKFSIDLTRLQHALGRGQSHLVDMSIGVVLEHIVPHTESLLSVIMASAFNDVFKVKFEFVAQVEGEGQNRRIVVNLERKIVCGEAGGEVTIQRDINKTLEVLKTKLKQDKKGNVSVKRKQIFMDSIGGGDQQGGENGQLVEVARFLDLASPVLQLYGSSGCNTKLLDYYAECRLCSKFSFPDFRLTASVKHREGVALCENCCETILTLCVPSEPEKIPGRGEVCLLLGVEKNTGHRLVLSNNSKKWISADGVEKIQAVSEVASTSTIPDYGSTLVQLLKSHLVAVCERAWSDPSCLTARAGFSVLSPVAEQNQLDEITGQPKQQPIEVKVTIRPPKPKTPPPKLMITPVKLAGEGKRTSAAATSASPGSKLVKITANRRIIPVRDPTSISSPPQMPGVKPMAKGDAETKAKIAALRESLKANAKLNDSENNRTPRLPTATTVTSVESPGTSRKKAPIRPGVILPDDDSDLEGDDDAIESIDAIADFISSSEPVRPKGQQPAGAASNPVPACDVTDEFTADTVLSSPSPRLSQPQDATGQPSQPRLPSSTVVTSLPSTNLPSSTIITNLDDPPDKAPVAEEEAPLEAGELKLPPGLKLTMAPAGMVKLAAGPPDPPAQVLQLDVGPSLLASPNSLLPQIKDCIVQATLVEVGTPALPSPASDATTSTKDTVTPSSLLGKAKKLMASNIVEGSKSTEKTSTVNKPKPRGRPKKIVTEQETESTVLAGSELDMESEEDDIMLGELMGISGEEAEGIVKKKTGGVKLSSLLPRGMGKVASPASSSKKGSTTTTTTAKAGVKRKRAEELGTPEPVSRLKKAKKTASESEDEIEQKWPFPCDSCSKGFNRLADLKSHMKLHDEGAPPREFKIDITKEEQELANELLNPEKPQPMRKAGITKSALKTPRVGRENYDQVIFDHIKKGYFGEQNL